GSVVITVKDSGGSSSSSSGSGDINYSVDAEDTVDFDEGDFNDYCQDENDEDLDYVKFTLPSSSKGVLWYDYDGNDEEKVDDAVKYYYDKDLSIDDITFVPDDSYSGNCKIEFEGEDAAGDTIDGTVVIAVANEDLAADVIYLSGTAGTPVTMYDEYLNKECKEVLNNTLDYVKFTLPSASNGILYYNYSSGGSSATKVSASTKYYYENDSPYLSKVSFVSAGSSAGTYTVKYTGYDTDGSSFTGEVNITLAAGSGTAAPGAGSLYFSDVNGNYSWAVLYVDTLYSTSVITGEPASDGTKRFNPGTAITRGDFMLYLCKALNLSSASATSNFSDVAVGSYYYDAVATAKALGIAQGSNNKFYPNSTITREDAMALALRAMNMSGNSVGTGIISDLSKYSDNGSVSSYAKEAVAALIKAGIVTGSSDGKLYPKSTITRAESAAVIYRIKY
ncbi:MAG TPA: S-layer homology domain-containing protein, partial [Anaerovoracaceae bacterium]|nr:S-layer homology domain-containing protein [Anaerovoracaceae bacterium]